MKKAITVKNEGRVYYICITSLLVYEGEALGLI